MSYFVSRQFYYYQQINVVEIAYPSIDSSGPDMLISKYQGEGEEYIDPREALEIALAIRASWQADNPDKDIHITFGCMEFGEGEPEEDIEDLKKRVQKIYDNLPKCDYCNELINEKEYYVHEDSEYTESKFCSESHADKAYYQGFDICYVCNMEYPRENMNQKDNGIFYCDECQKLEDSYELIEIQKINDNSFVGFWLEDQQITRYLLNKTYMNEKDLSNLIDMTEKMVIDINVVDEDRNIINQYIVG